MDIFRNRPLALTACVMGVVAVLAVKLSAFWKLLLWICLFLAVFSLIFVALFRKRWGKRLSVSVMCLFAAGLAILQSWFWFDTAEQRLGLSEGAVVTVEGYVNERLTESSYGNRISVSLSEINGKRIRAKALLEYDTISSLQAGDRFRLTGTVEVAENSHYADGYRLVIQTDSAASYTVYKEKQQTFMLWIREVREKASMRLSYAIGGEEGNLAAALLLGDRSGLSGDTVLDFRRGGISHLLALSGLHVSVLIGFFEILLRKCHVKKLIRSLIVPLLAVFYLLLTGCSPSTARAVLMLCVLYVSFLLREDYDSFTALGAALMGILILSPNAVLDLSLWMSFSAAAAIVIFVPIITDLFGEASRLSGLPKFLRKLLRAIITALIVGVAANAAILPLSAYFFGQTSVFSVGLTLLLSPILTPILALSAICLFFSFWSPLLLVTRLLLGWMLEIASWFSEQRNAIVLLDGKITVALLVVLTVFLILFAVLEWKKRAWLGLIPALSALILIVAGMDTLPSEKGAFVTYLRSHEDEALVIAEKHTAVAIDFSSGGSYMAYSIVSAVDQARCTELEELILTHYHSGASATIASLTQQIKLRTLRLPEPCCEKERAIANRLAQEADLHGVSVVYGGGTTALDSLTLSRWERLADEERIEVPTYLSMQIRGHHAVYLSDGVLSTELAPFANNLAIDSDLLILGAHGNGQAPSTDFYRRLHGVERIIFGCEELFAACPPEALPGVYAVSPSIKQFFLK